LLREEMKFLKKKILQGKEVHRRGGPRMGNRGQDRKGKEGWGREGGERRRVIECHTGKRGGKA